MAITVRQIALSTGSTARATFASNVLAGSVVVCCMWERTNVANGDVFVVLTGTSTADTSWTNLVRQCDGGNDTIGMQAKVAAAAGPFGTIESNSITSGKLGRLVLLELVGAKLAGAQSAKLNDQTGTTNINVTTFTGMVLGADIVILICQRATEADPSYSVAGGWNQFIDTNQSPTFHPWSWGAYRQNSAAASTTFSNGAGVGWSAGAAMIRAVLTPPAIGEPGGSLW